MSYQQPKSNIHLAAFTSASYGRNQSRHSEAEHVCNLCHRPMSAFKEAGKVTASIPVIIAGDAYIPANEEELEAARQAQAEGFTGVWGEVEVIEVPIGPSCLTRLKRELKREEGVKLIFTKD